MGTWGEGLFESDDALDTIDELIDALDDADVGADTGDIESGEADPELVALLGDVSPDLRALCRRHPKAVATACAAHLDRLGEHDDLYEAAGPLGASLGLLLLCDAPVPAPRLHAWRAAVRHLDEHTPDEREFWDAYMQRVHTALTLLTPAA